MNEIQEREATVERDRPMTKMEVWKALGYSESFIKKHFYGFGRRAA